MEACISCAGWLKLSHKQRQVAVKSINLSGLASKRLSRAAKLRQALARQDMSAVCLGLGRQKSRVEGQKENGCIDCFHRKDRPYVKKRLLPSPAQ